MDHLPGLCMTGSRIDLPLLRRGTNQQHTSGGACLAHRIPCVTDRSRAAGQLTAEQRIHEELLVGRRVVERDAVERDFELFRDQHRDRRVDALAHLDLGDHQRHLAGVVDLDKGVRREHPSRCGFARIPADYRFARWILALRLAHGRQAEAEQQAAACGNTHRDTEFQKSTAGKMRAVITLSGALAALRGSSSAAGVLRIKQTLRHVRPPLPLA